MSERRPLPVLTTDGFSRCDSVGLCLNGLHDWDDAMMIQSTHDGVPKRQCSACWYFSRWLASRRKPSAARSTVFSDRCPKGHFLHPANAFVRRASAACESVGMYCRACAYVENNRHAFERRRLRSVDRSNRVLRGAEAPLAAGPHRGLTFADSLAVRTAALSDPWQYVGEKPYNPMPEIDRTFQVLRASVRDGLQYLRFGKNTVLVMNRNAPVAVANKDLVFALSATAESAYADADERLCGIFKHGKFVILTDVKSCREAQAWFFGRMTFPDFLLALRRRRYENVGPLTPELPALAKKVGS